MTTSAFKPVLVLWILALSPSAGAQSALFSCEGLSKPEDRAVVSIDGDRIVVNSIPYLTERADDRFIYARLDSARASEIQAEYFPKRSLMVDREEGRVIELKDHDLGLIAGNSIEWSCRAVKSWRPEG